MNELFGDNRTKLAAVAEAESVIPIMPGVSAATGLYEAMLDNMKSDLAIYEAMMSMDALELKARHEGTFNEGVADTLKKAGKKIINVVIEGLKKLASWIKSTISAFTLAIYKKLNDDELLIKKYRKEFTSNENVAKTVVLWRDVSPIAQSDAGLKAIERVTTVGFSPSLMHAFSKNTEDYEKTFWDQIPEETTVKKIMDKGINAFYKTDAYYKTEIGKIGANNIILFMIDYKKKVTEFSKKIDVAVNAINKASKEVEKYIDDNIASSVETRSGDGYYDKTTNFANKEDSRQAYFIQDVFRIYKKSTTDTINATKDFYIAQYKMNKAAFMKGVSALAGVKDEAAVESFIEEEMNDIDAVLADTTSDEVIEILNKQTSMDTEMDDDEIGVEASKQEEEGESAPADETQEPFSAEEAAFFEAPLF